MKNLKTYLCGVLLAVAPAAMAQECMMPLSIYLPQQAQAESNGLLPDEATSVLENALVRMCDNAHLMTDLNVSQFILTARMNVLNKEIIPSAPTKVMYNIGVTFYIADVYTQTKFGSAYLELKGVGNNETKALIDATKRINVQNAKISALVEKGKAKMLDYYNNHYKEVLAQAERKAGLQEYEAAITLCMAVPACSKGGDAAQKAGLKYYEKYRDLVCQRQLTQARALWAATQDRSTAEQVAALLADIDPESTSYKGALELIDQIKQQVRLDIDLEKRQQYEDAVDLEKRRIDAMREVGVAYGKNQKPTTTNLAWLR